MAPFASLPGLPAHARSLSPASRRFLFLLALYLVPHAIIRLLLSRSLEFDEAEQLLFAQTLAPGYSPQPPLYTWLLWPLVRTFGANVLALTLLKIGLLAAIFALLHRLAARVIDDGRLALLATFTPLLMPVFAWEAIRMMTHTALLCVCSLATALTALRVRDRGRTADYALLGVWAGLGLLSKYNYALFAAALAGAALLVPAFRARLLDRRAALSVAVAAALFAAHGAWLASHWGEAQEYVLKYSRTAPEDVTVKGPLAGVGSLGWSLLLALATPALAALIFLPAALRPVRAGGSASDETRLFGWSFVVALVLLTALVAAGVRGYRAHWFAPFLLLLPVWLASRLTRAPLPTWRVRGYGLALSAAAVTVLLVRLAALGFDYDGGKYQTRDFLYADVAARVREAGVRPAAILAQDPVSGGYELLYFPGAKVRCVPYPSCRVPGDGGEGPLLVVWDSTYALAPPPELTASLADHFGHAWPLGRASFVEAGARVFKSRTRRLGYMVLASPRSDRYLAGGPDRR